MLEYSMDELSEQLTASKTAYAALAAELENSPDDAALAVCIESLNSHIKDLAQKLRQNDSKPVLSSRKREQLVAV